MVQWAHQPPPGVHWVIHPSDLVFGDGRFSYLRCFYFSQVTGFPFVQGNKFPALVHFTGTDDRYIRNRCQPFFHFGWHSQNPDLITKIHKGSNLFDINCKCPLPRHHPRASVPVHEAEPGMMVGWPACTLLPGTLVVIFDIEKAQFIGIIENGTAKIIMKGIEGGIDEIDFSIADTVKRFSLMPPGQIFRSGIFLSDNCNHPGNRLGQGNPSPLFCTGIQLMVFANGSLPLHREIKKGKPAFSV